MNQNQKLQKRLNKNHDRLFYVVYDPTKQEYYDLFEFPRFKIIPTIEQRIFKYFSDTFTSLFSERNYDYNFFNATLMLNYKIHLSERDEVKDKSKYIDYKTSTLLENLYLELRYKDLYNLINSFKGKLTVEGVEALREKILKMNVDTFSPDTKKYFQSFKNMMEFTGDDAVLFKEILYLTIYDEYKRALTRTTKINDLNDHLSKIANKKNKNSQEKLEEKNIYNELCKMVTSVQY